MSVEPNPETTLNLPSFDMGAFLLDVNDTQSLCEALDADRSIDSLR